MRKKLQLAVMAALASPAHPAFSADTTTGWECQQLASGEWSCHASGATPLPRPTITPAITSPSRTRDRSGKRLTQIMPERAIPQGPWGLCQPVGQLSAPIPAADQTDIAIASDAATIEQSQIYHLQGNAVIERAGQRILADRLDYDERTGEVTAEARVVIEESDLKVIGTSGQMNMDTDQGRLDGVTYQLFSKHAQGSAVTAWQDSPILKRFEQATYSTCDADNEVWQIDAKEVRLHEDEGIGRAYHAKLRIGSIPVLYTPYISFPLDDRRKSGLLVPSWGTSDESGTDITVPYYWNIAPHRDATITPRLLSKRGVQLKGEFRYLNPEDNGQIDLEVLPSDDAYNSQDRYLFGWEHSGHLQPNLYTRTSIRSVSDDAYFEDLGNSLGLAATTHLERVAEATYNQPFWSLTGRLQDYQTVDRTIPGASRPYKRLPQVVFNANPDWHPHGIQTSLNAEAVHFDQDNRVTATRLDVHPKISLPFSTPGYFVTPALGLRATHYSLDNISAGAASSHSRTVPMLSLDSGLFFERNLDWLGEGFIQTLEPRAYYLYVPKRDQSTIPVFDTGLPELSYYNLFTPNRFSGADRIGDANQLTLAVTSRILNPVTGVQKINVSLGAIQYFQDREVTLPGYAIQKTSSSNLIGQLTASVTDSLSLEAGIQWDPFESRTELGNFHVRYQPDSRHVINAGYRFRDRQLEQTDLSGVWYLTPRWHLVGLWQYSLQDNNLLEGMAGVEYESCCWVARLARHRYVNDAINNPTDPNNDIIMFQLELKGLTSFGDPIRNMLENDILGYQANP